MNTQQTAKTSTSNRAYWAQVIVLGLVVGLGLQFAQAWTAPTATAPGGNVTGPITTSGDTQTKAGRLNIGGVFTAAGSIIGDGSISGTVIRARTGLVLENDVMENCKRLKTNGSGSVGCASATPSDSDIKRSRRYDCEARSKDDARDCAIPDDHRACFLTSVVAADAGGDVNGFACTVFPSPSGSDNWIIRMLSDGNGVRCYATCID